MRSSLFGFTGLKFQLSDVEFCRTVFGLPLNREKRIWVKKVLHSLM